jgi:phage terminase large subunit-like protein
MKTETLEKALKVADKIAEVEETNAISFYEPYEYQKSFHEARDNNGRLARQRLLMAANKTGKTFCGAAELAIHLTGRYPDWWRGTKFTGPIQAWAAGDTSYNTRDIVQAELLGEPGDEENFGKGAIPKDAIGKTERQPGIPNAYQSLLVKHTSGRNSKLYFKSYEQGRKAWMGKAVDVTWLDEEPPQEIYSQALRAALKTGGLVYMTFTPESGMTQVIAQFMNNLQPHQQIFNATWDDAPHLNEEVKREILAALPEHEREMRSKGVPVLGSGLVFPIKESDVRVQSFSIPDHWSRICGIDFGWDHPTATVWLAHNRDADTVYLYDCYRKSAETPIVHSAAIKKRGAWIPVIWPHDGSQHDKGSGISLAESYRRQGLNMHRKHFENPEGGQSVEPGIMEVLDRMRTSRFFVFDHLSDWFEELRMYHRKDGKIVKFKDDLMSATRYATQSLRFAKAGERQRLQTTAYGTFDSEWDHFRKEVA